MTRTLLAVSMALIFVGCDSAPIDEDADVRMDAAVADADVVDMDASVEEELVCDGGGCWVGRCRELTYASGAGTEMPEVGAMRDGAFVPYTDGGQAILVYGFQGGVMIQPVVRVPEDMLPDETCVEITVRNRPDPAYPDFAGELAEFTQTVFIDPLRPGSAGFLSATIFDQLGWMTAPELRMILEVELRAVDWVRSTSLALHVVDEDGLDTCDVVPRRSQFGCELAVLQGTLTVDSVGDTTAVACDETVDVTVTLDPDIEVPAECAELTRTIAVSRGCVQREGYGAGSVLGPTTWELPLDSSSGCSEPNFGLITSDCSCL